MSRPAPVSFTRLEEIAGGAYVVTDAAEISAREVCGARPAAVVCPTDAAQIAEILRFAAAEKLAVIPTGGCTKLGIGSPPARYDIALDLSRMNRVLAYDPQDLTLGVEPGVRIEDLLRTLAEKKQFLPLAVPFLDRATIGGIVAANSSSPLPQAQGSFVASFSLAEAAFDFCRAISHSVLTPQMVEIANPGTAALLFSGEISTRIEPRTWTVIVSAAGQPAVVDRHERELGRLAGAADAEEFFPLEAAEADSAFVQIREFPRLMIERVPAAAIFRISAVPGAMAALQGKLRVLAAQRELDFVSLARASGILYAAFLPQRDLSETPQAMPGIIS